MTRQQVLDLVARRRTYVQIGAELGISPGLAYQTATGLPADGSAAIAPEDHGRSGFVAGSTQHLSNPPAHNPTVKPEILAWVAERAAHDLRAAGAGVGPPPPGNPDQTAGEGS